MLIIILNIYNSNVQLHMPKYNSIVNTYTLALTYILFILGYSPKR